METKKIVLQFEDTPEMRQALRDLGEHAWRGDAFALFDAEVARVVDAGDPGGLATPAGEGEPALDHLVASVVHAVREFDGGTEHRCAGRRLVSGYHADCVRCCLFHALPEGARKLVDAPLGLYCARCGRPRSDHKAEPGEPGRHYECAGFALDGQDLARAAKVAEARMHGKNLDAAPVRLGDVVSWGGSPHRVAACSAEDRCLSCERRGWHLEPVS